MAAYVLDRAVWLFGGFVENEVSRFAHAQRDGAKKNEKISPKPEEIAEYRRALIEQTPYSKQNVARAKARQRRRTPRAMERRERPRGGAKDA